MIAIRFVGGNKTPAPSKEYTARDGYGARVMVDLGYEKLIREHRCGDGWSSQNSATMIVGIGQHRTVPQLSVRWPSGKTTVARDIREGTLVTVFENPGDGPEGQGAAQEPYRATLKEAEFTSAPRPTFPVAKLDQTLSSGSGGSSLLWKAVLLL